MKSLETLTTEQLALLAAQAATTFNSTIKVGLLFSYLVVVLKLNQFQHIQYQWLIH